MKTTTTILTTIFLLAILTTSLQAQNTRIKPAGDVTSNIGVQDLEGFLNQTIEIKFGAGTTQMQLMVGSIAAITFDDLVEFIGALGEDFELSDYVGVLGEDFELSSHIGIRKLDNKRVAIKGIAPGTQSLRFKNKKGREAILKITVTKPEEQQEIEKE